MKYATIKHLSDILVAPDLSVLDAIRVLDRTALQILLVTDQISGRLKGTVTDGDIRRAILNSMDIKGPISNVMNKNAVTVGLNVDHDTVLSLMHSKSIHSVPVVDEQQQVLGLKTKSQLLLRDIVPTCVVLMAGGQGMRLRPLTESTPKPLLEVNGKPVLEHIIGRFVKQGFRRFFLSVNYKSEMIKNHFGNGKDYGVEISYIEEDKPLGTGGALSLLQVKEMSENIIVMNGDLLTTVNFRQLLDFHRAHGGVATMAVRDYSFRVPYGVVQVDSEDFVDIIEKPAHSYFVNTGIYMINSNQLQHIPKDTFFDLPDLFSMLKSHRQKVTVFPLREEWRDIGSFHDYEQAQGEVAE